MNKCNTCHKQYSPDCDYRQGRCPHHPPYIDSRRARFLQLFNAIKEWIKK